MANNSEHSNSSQDAQATRDVQELLEQGRKLGLAIDTNFYINTGRGTLDVPFRLKLVNGNGHFLHLIPHVWEREIKKHLRSRLEIAKGKALSLSERDVSPLRSQEVTSAVKALRTVAAEVDVTETINSLWDQFASETNAVVVSLPNDSAATVLDWYFESHLPFEESGSKKNEFPDAFALHSLSKFAEDNDLHVVVVATKDIGAYGHCIKAEKLLAFRDVQSALGAFDAKEMIEQRRELSVAASRDLHGERLQKLMDRLVRFINRPYSHAQQPWPAITKPSFPQNPRILIDELLGYELVPFGNFGLPVSVTNVLSEQEWAGVNGILARVKVKIRCRVSCEISAIDVVNPARNSPRQTFPLGSPVEADVTLDFASALPLMDGDPRQFELLGPYEQLNEGFVGIEIDSLHVTVPDHFEYRGFA
ncbi:MAG: DUF4935 domain-containing protein [Zoogloea sp.]|nr:DUF4935 domain-containing protein [Zoogloea sp.]MCA0184709.1 PIN domain-containing protein [Pseudomonadota bacterium]